MISVQIYQLDLFDFFTRLVGQLSSWNPKPIFGSGEMPWWWSRVPTLLVGELRHDFERLG